ncbi:hypothetical protein DRN97_06795 [Methanosarcinales archaeon]|nr:MAG: hypothetical protein DRN97_06795 [Methanosarcinales archaeon]
MERIQQRIFLSRNSLNSIEFEHEVLRIPLRAGEETSFEMFVINHGEPTHVHFSLSEEIKDKVMVLQDKIYVIDKEKVAAIVKLPKSYAGAVAELGAGEIFISTGYGATKKSFSLDIVEAEEERIAGERIEGKLEEKEIEKREVTVSPERLALLRRLEVSTVALALLLLFVFVVFTFPVHSFIFALIASMIFIFIVLYNL